MTIGEAQKYILTLYRTILREGNKFPKESQRNFVRYKAAKMFRENIETQQQMEDAIRLAHTHIDNIQAQVSSHKKMYLDDRISEEEYERMRQKQIQEDSEKYRAEEAKTWEH